jgi:hypothetical protein
MLEMINPALSIVQYWEGKTRISTVMDVENK